MNIKTIKKELKGYFLLKNQGHQLARKTDENNFKIYGADVEIIDGKDRVRYTPQRYLLRNIQSSIINPEDFNKVNGLQDILPVLDFRVFKNYDNRNDTIAKHKAILEQLKPKKALFGKKDNILVHIDNSERTGKDDEYFIYNANTKELLDVDAKLVDDAINDAITFNNLSLLRKAINDDLKNKYEKKYKEEVKLWESL